MDLNTPYDQENIFAKIIKGDIPCIKLYEDDHILSFMDMFPQSVGHSLVISKSATAVNLFDIDQDNLCHLIKGAQKIGNAAKIALKPDGIKLAQFSGNAAGQTVFHLHFHIIPVFENGHILDQTDPTDEAKNARLVKIAELIRKEINN